MANKMAEVARIFGKELGEEFNVKYRVRGNRIRICKAKFIEDFLAVETYNGCIVSNDLVLRQLISGKAEITEEEA